MDNEKREIKQRELRETDYIAYRIIRYMQMWHYDNGWYSAVSIGCGLNPMRSGNDKDSFNDIQRGLDVLKTMGYADQNPPDQWPENQWHLTHVGLDTFPPY